MKRKSSLGAVVLTCSLVPIVVLAACSQSSTSSAPSTSTSNEVKTSEAKKPEAPKEPPVVTAFMGRGTDFPEKNRVIDEIRKQSGINLQVQTALFADYDTKLNTLLVSGQAPDIFNVNKAKLKELVANDVILPLDDLLAKDGKEIIADKGNNMKGSAYINGKTYGIPRAVGSGNVLAIRQDWLDKLKLPVPTTLDEYETVLRAFVKNDPDGNGKNDTIGLGLAMPYTEGWSHIFGAFGVPQYRQVLVDGQVIPWMLAPGYVDAIKYWNKLYQEGLIEPEFATIARLPAVEKLWNGKVGAWQSGASGISTNWVSRYTDNPKPKFVYTTIKGPNGKGGYLKTHREDSGTYTVINKKAKNPAAAMQMINYLTSLKGDTLVYFGMEGTHYKYVDGKFQTIPPFDDAVKLRNDGGFMYTELVNRQNALQYELQSEETKRGNKVAEENTIDEIYLYETPKVEVDKGSVMKDMEEEFRAKAISGKSSDIDRLYETFKTNYLKEGGSEWIKQATKIYEDQKAAKK